MYEIFVINFMLIFVSIFNFVISLDTSIKSEHTKVGNYPSMNMKTCGLISTQNDTNLKFRIINGEFAELNEVPWAVTIFHKYRPKSRWHFCDGVLINKFWVLSAKHCFEPRGKVELYPIVLNISMGTIDANVFYQSYNVDLIAKHPTIDLALLRLSREVSPVLSEDGKSYRINFICLPNLNTFNNKTESAIITGFGSSNYEDNPRNTRLRKAVTTIEPVGPTSKCFKYFYYTKEFVCGEETKNMLCYGDSGSGLVQFDSLTNRAMVIGILEGGKQFDKTGHDCGPGIFYYNRVSQFIGFLRDYIVKDVRAESTTARPTRQMRNTSNTIFIIVTSTESAVNDQNTFQNTFKTELIFSLNLMLIIINIFFI